MPLHAVYMMCHDVSRCYSCTLHRVPRQQVNDPTLGPQDVLFHWTGRNWRVMWPSPERKPSFWPCRQRGRHFQGELQISTERRFPIPHPGIQGRCNDLRAFLSLILQPLFTDFANWTTDLYLGRCDGHGQHGGHGVWGLWRSWGKAVLRWSKTAATCMATIGPSILDRQKKKKKSPPMIWLASDSHCECSILSAFGITSPFSNRLPQFSDMVA